MTEPANPEPRENPRTAYEQRLAQRREDAARQAGRDLAISSMRLAIFVIAGTLAWLWYVLGTISVRWLALPALAFTVLVVVHERVIRSRRRFERAAAYYESCIARLDHDWAGRGEFGRRFLDESHIYAADLDLFGRGSLFELLCTARTRAGEEALAAWLRSPAGPREILARQEAVDELRSRLDLREDLAMLGADMRAGVDPEALAAWGAAPLVLTARSARISAGALSALSMTALLLWGAGLAGPMPFLAALAAQGAIAFRQRARVRRVLGSVEKAVRDLALLSQVLERFERERFVSKRLVALRAALDTEGMPPSKRIARLQRLIEILDARRNQIFAPLAFLLMWGTQLAHAIEAWRSTSGEAIARWLGAVGESEALGALAGYAFENPEDPFPEVIPGGAALFEGEGLGHPLIPAGRCVRNDVRLGKDAGVLIVSGSNMSGKSTLLRTVGTNTVLAMAGAPVRARRLRISPLSVGASIGIHDSLQQGTSHFYAEITRLKQIVEQAKGEVPALFLIDEMLSGTNSHDRRIGAEAVVKGLVERKAIGLVATHDLALSRITESLGPRAANVHFEDHLENGRMTFDYIMRAGVVKKSNALALMRAVGLDI